MAEIDYSEALYTNSKGQDKRVVDMHFPHLKNAVEKLLREDPENDQLPAMQARLADLQAAYEAEQEANGEAGEE